MMAVWGLTGCRSRRSPCTGLYDARVIVKSLEMAVGSDTLSVEALDKVKSVTDKSTAKLLDEALKHTPEPAWT